MRRSFGIFMAGMLASVLTLTSASRAAFAQATARPPAPEGAPASASEAAPSSILPEAPLEAPPPPPHRKGLVLESRLGALAFLGDFRHLSPTAPWWHTDLGYELLNWLAVFGYGELAFTSTSESQGPSNAIAFPIFGFGGGARITVHVTRRVALFLEGDAGAMKADVPHGALVDLGFGNAERLGLTFGGRLGVEWYQVDRHLAFGLDVGLRDATGFAKEFVGSGPPLMIDASAAVRYTF